MFFYKHASFQQTSIFRAKTIYLKITDWFCLGLVSFPWHAVRYCSQSVHGPPSPITGGISMAMDLQQGLAGSFLGVGGGFFAVRGDQAATMGREHHSSFSGKSQQRSNSIPPAKSAPSPVAAPIPHPCTCYSILGLFKEKFYSFHLKSGWHHLILPAAGTLSSATVKADQSAAESRSGGATDRWGHNYILIFIFFLGSCFNASGVSLPPGPHHTRSLQDKWAGWVRAGISPA